MLEGGIRLSHAIYIVENYKPREIVNVKRLSEEEALQVVQEFLENSCRNHNNCNKVYESFIRGDLQRVKSKGLKSVSIKKFREKDPELHSLIEQTLQN
jgi:hypothetical protein